MNTTLHILNGDATLWSLDKAGISGEILVWRDVLCEGPVIGDFASPDFWEKRTEFMSTFFGAEPKGFKSSALRNLIKSKQPLNSLNWYFGLNMISFAKSIC